MIMAMSKYTHEEFIKKCHDIHGDIYNYENTLYINSRTKVEITCKIHGIFKQLPWAHLQGQGCSKCGIEKRKKTNINRYGVEHTLQSPVFKKKKEKTTEKKYGVKYISQNSEYKKTLEQNNLSKYGVKHYYQTEEFKKKRKDSLKELYSVEHPLQNDYILNKKNNTTKKRYGEIHALKNKKLLEKKHKTSTIRYGVENFSQKHISKRNLEKINDPNWLKNEHHVLKKTLSQISYELKLHHSTIPLYFKKFNIKIKKFNSSFKAIQWLELIMKNNNIYIQHAKNEGEYYIQYTKYHVDGFCKETHTVYEFYGDYWHGNLKIYNPYDVINLGYDKKYFAIHLYNKTKKREQEIKNLGYNLITIWETDWNEQQNHFK